MRVLHIVGGLGLGGAETLLYRLATRDSGIDHSVICLFERGWYSAPLEEAGILVHHLDILSAVELPFGLWRLRRLIKQSRADVVQTWLYRANVAGGVVARLSNIPVIWSIHSSAVPVGSASRIAARVGPMLAGWVPELVINCSIRSTELHRQWGYGRAPGKVIHNGFDSQAFFPDETSRATTRQSLGIAESTFLVGSISRWHPSKDTPTFLAALHILSKRGIPVQAILVGDGLGSDSAELRASVAETGCDQLVLPLGRRSDIADVARAMDLHVLSSFNEAFPNVVAETMLSGSPNVVTDVGDCALMVGDSGWVVPSDSPEKLADAIEAAYGEWKQRPAEWQKRRVAARRRIAETFTFEGMAKEYDSVWRQVAATGRSSKQ